MVMSKEEEILRKRFIELSRTAYQRGIVTFSDFLNLNEQNILYTIPNNELYSGYQMFGGYDLSERQMVAFLPDALCCDYFYPISVLQIKPMHSKFSEDLTHRDYLGAILNLGIDRSKIGDILLDRQSAILFVQNNLEEFMMQELRKVRHTLVNVEKITLDSYHFQQSVKEITGSVSSLRLDSVLSVAFSSSRNKLISYIESGKVFVNGKLITSNGYQLKEQDIISVRGLGKFQYQNVISTTKKGRLFVRIHLYS